jgi:hypothetical protein
MLYYRHMDDHTNRALVVVMIIILIVIAILIFLPHETFYANPVTFQQAQPAIIRTDVPVENHVVYTTTTIPSSSSSSYQQQNSTTTTTTSQQ